MLRAQYLLLVLAYFRVGLAIEEDNLRNALNSIENRQRQLAASYYPLPNKDERPLQLDDDNLMFLDSSPSDFDIPPRSRLGPPPKSSKTYRTYDDDRLGTGYDDGEEYQKALNERLLEQLMLDMLKYEEDEQSAPSAAYHHRRSPQKKSFFREREINEISDNLQNLYPNSVSDVAADEAAAAFYAPATSFRERVQSSKPSHPSSGNAVAAAAAAAASPHRHLPKPYADSELDVDDAYLNAVNPLWHKYEGLDPETMTEEDANLFLKYLSDKESLPSPDDDYEVPEAFASEYRARDRSKRYWLGGAARTSGKYSIRKRSAVEEKPSSDGQTAGSASAPNATHANTTAVANKTATAANVSSTTAMRIPQTKEAEKRISKRGQQEIPVDLTSLKPLNIKKKSVDWSNYFGMDKRSKKSAPATTAREQQQHKNDVLLDQYIQSYILQSVRNSAFNNRASGNNYRYLPKRNVGSGAKGYFGDAAYQKSETDEEDDLQTVEDMIIDNVLKYTGAHEGTSDPAELQRIRQKVIDELWLAYNLEKLRNNYYDDDQPTESERIKKEHQHSTIKRVAVKKENAELVPAESENLKKNKHNSTASSYSTSKKNLIDYSKYRYNSGTADECPVLDQIIGQCLQIGTEVKDREQIFTPYCTLHHICNICGAKQDSLSCDLSFFTDVNAICGDEPDCRYTAERVLYFIKNQPATSHLSAKACDSCISQILPYNFEI